MTKHLIAEFTAAPGAEQRVSALLGQLTRAVRAEPGNVAFDTYTRTDHGATFVVVEAYRDEDAFRAHLDSAHGREFNRQLSGLVQGGGSELTFLTPLVPSE